MATAEERMKILQMIKDGRITAEEGAKLLSALGERPQTQPAINGRSALVSREGHRYGHREN
jgi:hypothetical protein